MALSIIFATHTHRKKFRSKKECKTKSLNPYDFKLKHRFVDVLENYTKKTDCIH